MPNNCRSRTDLTGDTPNIRTQPSPIGADNDHAITRWLYARLYYVFGFYAA